MEVNPDLVPAYARLKNTVRVHFTEGGEDKRGLKYVVKDVLGDLLRIQKTDLLSIQDYPKRGDYDITFNKEGTFRDTMALVEKNCHSPVLEGIRVVEHVLEETRLVVIKMYSPYVTEQEIMTFLSVYFKKVQSMGKIMNEFDIWTSKRKFLVTCIRDPSCAGGVRLPPGRFKLGQTNGDLYFTGMPRFCRFCQKYGHTKEQCDSTCRHCGSTEHLSETCGERRCRLCQNLGHLYANCPFRSKTEQPKAPPQPPADQTHPKGEEPMAGAPTSQQSEGNKEQGTGAPKATSQSDPLLKPHNAAERRLAKRKAEREKKGEKAAGSREVRGAAAVGLRPGSSEEEDDPDWEKVGPRKSGKKGRLVRRVVEEGKIDTPPAEGGEKSDPPEAHPPLGKGVIASDGSETPPCAQPSPTDRLDWSQGEEAEPVGDPPDEDLNGQPMETQVSMAQAGLPDYAKIVARGILSEGSSSPISSLLTVESDEGGSMSSSEMSGFAGGI